MLRLGSIYKGWWVVAAGFGALFVSAGATGWGFSVMIEPMQQGLGWDRATLTGALTVSGYLTGLLSAPLGPLVDRYGARLMMVASAFLAGLSLCLLAFVTETWQYYLLIGLGLGVSQPCLSGLGPRTSISNWFIRKRALAFSVFSVGSAAAGIFTVPVLNFIIEISNWRMGWIYMGVLAWVLVIPLSWFFIRRRPEDAGLLPDGDKPGPVHEGASPEPVIETAALPEDNWTRSKALRTRTFWLLVVSFMLTGLPSGAIFINLVPHFIDKGMSPTTAALALSIYAIGVLPGRFAWGFVAGRIGVHNALVSYAGCYGLAIALFVLSPASEVATFTTTFILGAAVSGGFQLQGQVWADYYGRRIVGSMTGFSVILATPLTAAGPFLAALSFDWTGSYTLIFSIFSVLCLTAVVTQSLAKKPKPPATGSIKQQAV